MKLEDLVHAILGDRPLEARQWVADAVRAGIRFDQLPLPDLESKRERALAAGLAELLAIRGDQAPPAWTTEVGPLAEPFFVSRRLQQMPRSAEEARVNGPEPLRRRNVYASPNFLSIR